MSGPRGPRGAPPGGEPARDDDDEAAAGAERVDRSVISVPLLERLREGGAALETAVGEPWLRVVVDLDYTFPGGVGLAARKVTWMLRACTARTLGTATAGAAPVAPADLDIEVQGQFLFARAPDAAIREVAALDRAPPDDDAWRSWQAYRPFAMARKHFARRAIHRIWPDFETRALRRA